jgi:hypothetical protein
MIRVKSVDDSTSDFHSNVGALVDRRQTLKVFYATPGLPAGSRAAIFPATVINNFTSIKKEPLKRFFLGSEEDLSVLLGTTANATTDCAVNTGAFAASVTSGKATGFAILATFGTDFCVKVGTVLLLVGCGGTLATSFSSSHKTLVLPLVVCRFEKEGFATTNGAKTLLSFRIVLMIALYDAYVNNIYFLNPDTACFAQS